jgi:hypothetical protein
MKFLIPVLMFALFPLTSDAKFYDCVIGKEKLDFPADLDLTFTFETLSDKDGDYGKLSILGDLVDDECELENQVYICRDEERMPHTIDLSGDNLKLSIPGFLTDEVADCKTK